MGDAAQTLQEQIEHWESQKREAEEVIRIAESVLPGMRDGLRALGATRPNVEIPEEALALEREILQIGSPEAEPPAMKEVRRSDEIRKAVREALPYIDGTFTQTDLQGVMGELGYTVNKSTLRGNLKSMCDTRDGIAMASEGKGRRATVFEKKAPEGGAIVEA